MADDLPVYVWAFPSAKASESAYLSASRRLIAERAGKTDLLMSQVHGVGPLEGTHLIVAVGRDAGPRTCMGGKVVTDPPEGLVEAARARYAYMDTRYRYRGERDGVVSLHHSGGGGPVDPQGRVWVKGKPR